MSIQAKVFDVAKATRFILEHVDTGRHLVLPFGKGGKLVRGITEEEITAQDDDGNETVVAVVKTGSKPRLELMWSVLTPEVVEMIEGVLLETVTTTVQYGFLGTVPDGLELPEVTGTNILVGVAANTMRISIKDALNNSRVLLRQDWDPLVAVQENRFMAGPNGRVRFHSSLARAPFAASVPVPNVQQLKLSDVGIGEYRIYGTVLTNERDLWHFQANRGKPLGDLDLDFAERERTIPFRLFPELGSCRAYQYGKSSRTTQCLDLLAS